jgi:hypothetical protein
MQKLQAEQRALHLEKDALQLQAEKQMDHLQSIIFEKSTFVSVLVTTVETILPASRALSKSGPAAERTLKKTIADLEHALYHTNIELRGKKQIILVYQAHLAGFDAKLSSRDTRIAHLESLVTQLQEELGQRATDQPMTLQLAPSLA